MAASVREDPGAPGELEEENVVAEINITPLTDVFLVLLIIFMVTSSALVESESARSGVKVTLPKANAAGPVQQKKSDPVLTVTKDGQVFVGPKKIDDLGKLEDELRKALQDAASETVLVRGDQNVYLGKAVDIMTIAKRAGANHIGILTATPK
ncbi:MAG TPA: biopolymer transporter ExbD [Polyangia bacterium]|nr:biopolymer transporter ExbD [Polyangia bacterium]